MIENLINLLISRTGDGNIIWNTIPEKWGCEYGRSAAIQTREHTLRLELYYSDMNDEISDVVLLVYDLNTKLTQVTSSDYPKLKEIATDLFSLQLEIRDKVLTQAFRSLGAMPTKERIIPKKPVVEKIVEIQTQKTKTKIVTKIVEVEKIPKWKKWLKSKIDKF